MNSTSRIVRHLRLRASAESAIHRAVVLFQDALRTASLRDDAGRIVLVRKLALGRIDSRAAPQVVAMRLESAFERVAPECVYAGSAGAPQASAVWFRDALDAHTRLALRLAVGAPADAWYWRLAVRAWEPGTPLPQALRAIMLSLAALPEAPTALPQWTADLAAARHTERLAAALRVEDVPPLAQAAALRIAAVADVRLPMDSPRRLHDESDTLASNLPRRASDPTDGQRARAPGDAPAVDPRRELLKALLVAAGVDLKSARRHSAPPETGTQQSALPGAQSAREHPHASSALAGRTPNVRAPGETALVAETPAASIHRHGAGPIPRVSPDSLTRAGGLLFLIPVLRRAGYPEWLEMQPEWARCDIAQRVLAAVLTRLAIAPEDPAWLLACPSRTRTAPRRFVAPARWREGLSRGGATMRAAQIGSIQTLWDASGRLLLGAWSGRCPRALVDARRSAEPFTASCRETESAALAAAAWLVAARRWLRRSARIGLADLVLRPGLQSFTPTHADLHFERGACELRIRRSGLDFDPGWVPWLGRVVTFHYR